MKQFLPPLLVGRPRISRARISHRSVSRQPMAGFTLIEVMVALIVLVLGVLGAAAMTVTALRDSKQSSLRSQASALAYEIGDLIRMNPDPTVAMPVFLGSAPTGGVATCYTSGCSPTETATNDYYQWVTKLSAARSGLPNAAAVICRDATLLAQYPACDNLAMSPIVVKLRWDEKRNDGTFDTGTGPRLVVPMKFD